jgi:DNA-binding NarL/FixJ family response regulator
MAGLGADELHVLRTAAAALAAQDGDGVDRRALVALAEVGDRWALTLLDGEPPLAIARPLPGSSGLFAPLTPREREVAALLATGASNREIAAALVIAVPTVKDHVHRILEKTGLRSRTAVAAAWREGHRERA